MNPNHIENQAIKIASAWAFIGITSWGEAAAAAAFLYSMLLISEWFWKKIWRPLLVRLGYLPADRRKTDREETDTENE